MSAPSPSAVFHQHGLRTRAPWSALGVREGVSHAVRFRDALEELGGLYATFGRYLAWRADLLRSDYLLALRSIQAAAPPMARDEAVATLCRVLGLKGERIAASFSDEPVWSTVSRCAWRGTHEGRPIVVQFDRPAVPEKEFDRFARRVRSLREPGVAAALTDEAIDEFRAWLRLADASGRERAYLETLAGFPHKTLVEYPKIVPEACSAGILSWEWVEGDTLAQRVAEKDGAALAKLAEALLEQVCLLSVVDADLDLSAMAIDRNGRIALRRATRLVAIPAAMARTTLKYITAVLAGNSPYANHQLIRLAFGSSSTQMESRLYDELSNLEPELKINLQFPASAGAFESNWRALAHMRRARPLYLDALHRNLVAAGYCEADTAKGGGGDTVADAQWPVVGRLIRSRIGELTAGDIGSQWIMGSGLLAMEGLRQFTRFADGFRDNDLAFTFAPALSEEAVRKANRAVRTGVLVAVLLMVFLICLRWGPRAPAPWSGIVSAAAVISAALLLWLLWRLG
jgi:hypothetical protein